jgi:hypothetical protein
MATVDASGPFQWPLIIGIVAVVLVLPLSPRDAEITACFSFFVGLLNAGLDPISYPASGVERGACRRTDVLEHQRDGSRDSKS